MAKHNKPPRRNRAHYMKMAKLFKQLPPPHHMASAMPTDEHGEVQMDGRYLINITCPDGEVQSIELNTRMAWLVALVSYHTGELKLHGKVKWGVVEIHPTKGLPHTADVFFTQPQMMMLLSEYCKKVKALELNQFERIHLLDCLFKAAIDEGVVADR